MTKIKGKHVLFIVENLPVPFDRRVWQEATTLKENGMEVSIICPQMKGYTEPYQVLEGIEIYRHPLPFEARGALGYLVEYGVAIYWEKKLARKIFIKKPFHVIHGCNPPDLIYLTAKKYKRKGVKYVFDHHDINPELYIAKYDKKDFFYKLMCFFEKRTFQNADASIATNESYKNIAITRGGMNPNLVQVVRSGPKLDRLQLQEPILKYKKGKKYLLGYLGVIGEQEGIDLLLESMLQIVKIRQDVQLAIVGGGSDLELLKKLSKEKGLETYVDFYGRVSDQMLLDVLNTADVCVNPDKPTEMNNLSTMNKIMEYMALKKPIVQYDLKEGRFSANEASLYAKDTTDFANKIMQLLNDAEKRTEMGTFGYNRVLNELSWEFESEKLISFYDNLLK
ncbi:Glycosyltransferase involved in cell wall bisynthesis [Polaribacter sp. Hel1_33_78]|uniref:glycosyltransferase family 4 protein n=1 Tax=Polaribacter sp. Hel1_33_78 TaxID=1336804 RepID=UPI00087CC148|nr:glycosyltransferase family 4 protein [Polaribacter sp. Hel1_33_78]SDT95284.1 Glycosyltransferase involved in cell wall bisynthesis [Polaribacter sp. Hel1_33_78]